MLCGISIANHTLQWTMGTEVDLLLAHNMASNILLNYFASRLYESGRTTATGQISLLVSSPSLFYLQQAF